MLLFLTLAHIGRAEGYCNRFVYRGSTKKQFCGFNHMHALNKIGGAYIAGNKSG